MERSPQQEPCRLCGGPEVVPVYPKPYGVILGCRHCGIVLLYPPQGEESGRRAQQETFGQAWIEERLGQQDIIYRYARRRWDAIRRYVASGRLLEIGCGTGELLEVAARDGFEVTGVDSSPSSLEQIRSRFGFRDLYASMEALPAVPGQFDVVVMSHVLEHIYEPLPLLQRIYTELRPGGVLFVAVPNLGGWGARWLGGDWPGFLAAHVSYFTFETLRQLLARVGFGHIIRVNHGPPTLSLSLLNFAKCKILRRKEPLPDVIAGANLSAAARFTTKVLHLSARAALGLLHMLLYPVGLLQVRWGQTEELVVLAQK